MSLKQIKKDLDPIVSKVRMKNTTTNQKDDKDCDKFVGSGLTLTNISILHSPPRAFCKSCVKTDSLYGICCCFDARAVITLRKFIRDKLIFKVSFCRVDAVAESSPDVDIVALNLSLPARSTKFNTDSTVSRRVSLRPCKNS